MTERPVSKEEGGRAIHPDINLKAPPTPAHTHANTCHQRTHTTHTNTRKRNRVGHKEIHNHPTFKIQSVINEYLSALKKKKNAPTKPDKSPIQVHASYFLITKRILSFASNILSRRGMPYVDGLLKGIPSGSPST